MISTKKLIKMARKWQKLAAASRRRISWLKPPVADKGNFFVYTMDGRRFMVPLAYLKRDLVRELLRMAEEEFGVTRDGPITLPCDSVFMEYALAILQRHVTEDLERALILSSGDSCRSLTSSQQQHIETEKQLLICSY